MAEDDVKTVLEGDAEGLPLWSFVGIMSEVVLTSR